MRHYRFVRFPSRLKLTIGQISGVRSFMEKTNDKREYRRAIAMFQKADGKTLSDCIAIEHRVHVKTKYVATFQEAHISAEQSSIILSKARAGSIDLGMTRFGDYKNMT